MELCIKLVICESLSVTDYNYKAMY